MSININVGNKIPAEVVEVGQEISVDQLAAVTSASSPSAANPFTTATHTHVIANVTGLQTALDGKAVVAHTHIISNVDGLQTALDSKALAGHLHNIWDVTNLQTNLDGKAPLVHTHAIADTTGLQTALDGKSATTHLHSGVYAPVTHTHAIADTTGLQTALDSKSATTHLHTGVYAPITHSHAIADVTGLQTALDGKASAGNYALLTGASFSGEIEVPQIGNLLNTDLIIDAYNDTGAGTHYYHKFNPYGGLILAPNGGYFSAGGYSIDSSGFKTSWIEEGDMGRTFVLSKTGLTWDYTKSLNYTLGTGFAFTDKLTTLAPTSSDAGINIGTINSTANLTNSVAGDVWIGTWQMAYKTANGTLVYGAATNASNVFGAPQIIDTTHNTTPALRVTQKGTGQAIIVEDSTTPDTTSFAVSNNGCVGIGVDNTFVGNVSLNVLQNSNQHACWFRRTSGVDNGQPVVQITSQISTSTALYVKDGISVFEDGGIKISTLGNSDRPTINRVKNVVTATGTYNKEIPIVIEGIEYRISCRQV